MKLKKIVISGFKSIKKTEDFLIDKKITILIGANDHGKTNILEAIRCLNDDKPIKEEDENWDLEDEQPKLQWHFSLSKKEFDDLVENKKEQKEINEPKNPEVDQNQNSEEQKEKDNFPINEEKEIVYIREGVNAPVKILSLPYIMEKSREQEILKLRPRIELFAPPPTNVKDSVSLTELNAGGEFEFMEGIFRLAEIFDKKDGLFTSNSKTLKILDEASEKLTKKLNNDWNQGKNLTWKLKHNGDRIEIHIQDPAIDKRYSKPSLRSSGFHTYFLLTMITHARTAKNPNDSFIYLFDEPGTYLHPRAQFDLQRTFEVISDRSQMIYTTHSLFLISKNYPKRNRVISKTIEGTKIDQKPFRKNWKSVRESLGILLSNNFLIAEKTLLVEGPSDLIYILGTIRSLKDSEEIDIDLNDLSIVDAGNKENYVAMAKLMLSEGREIVALLDGDDGGKKIANKLSKICEAEIKKNELRIHLLEKNKSIENVCTDNTRLRSAVKQLSEDYIKNGLRKLNTGINLTNEIKKIQPKVKQTLGKTIDDITKNIFQQQEKLSKLSIALLYEDISEDQKLKTEKDGKKLILIIKKLLNLKGEKSTEKGVFEEVK